MPIVIEEMTIQVEVDQSRNAQQPGGSTATGAADDSKALIRKCVDEVMEVLRHQNER